MSKMSFLLTQMTFLRYFLPLTIAGNKRGVKSVYYYKSNAKYNNPEAYMIELDKYAEEYDFELCNLDVEKPRKSVVFMIEGCGREFLSKKHTKISITYMTDFTNLYKTYIDEMDHVIFPSESLAKHYKTLSDKNLYLGSPKFEVELDKEVIDKKYALPERKKALIICPKIRDLSSVHLRRVQTYLLNMGFAVLMKSRGKDNIPDVDRSAYYFTDASWFPHTSMELINQCDIVINYDSTAIKECVMMNTPVINFHVKPFKAPLACLYEYDFVRQLQVDITEGVFKTSVDYLLSAKGHMRSHFELCREEKLFETGEVCKNILDYLELK